MRNGRWTRQKDFGEGSADNPGFPEQPNWFSSIRDFPNLAVGLSDVGFSRDEIDGLMGMNWLRFYEHNFTAQDKG